MLIEVIKKVYICLLCVLSLCGLMCLTLLNVRTEISSDMITYACSLLGFGGVALICLCFQKVKLNWSILDALVLCFGVYIAINYFFLSNEPAANKGVEIVFMFVLYVILRVILSVNIKLKYILFFLFMLCVFYEAILGLRQLYGFSHSNHSLYKVTGTFFNSGPYSGYIVTILSISSAYIYRYNKAFSFMIKRNWIKLFFCPWSILYMAGGVCTIFSLLILPATLSRAAIVTYSFIITLLLLQRRNWKFIFSFLGVMLVLGIFLYFLKQGSADARLLLWCVLCSVISRNWLTGVGFGGFPSAYADGQAAFFEANPNSIFLLVASAPEYAFNEYLHIGVELGLIGLGLFLGIIGIALWLLFKHRNPMAYGLVALLVFACFSYPFSLLPFQIILVVFLSMAACEEKKDIVFSWKKQIIAILAVLISMGITCLLIPYIKKKVEVMAEFQKLSSLYAGDYLKGVEVDFKKIHDDLSDNPAFLFAYGRTMYKLERYNESNAILKEGILVSPDPMFYNIIGHNYKALGEFAMAENAYIKAFKILPNRLYPLYLLMNLYIETNQKEKVDKIARRIIIFEPKIKSKATNDMKQKAIDYINNK